MQQKAVGFLETITFNPRRAMGRMTYQIEAPFEPYSLLQDRTYNSQFLDLKNDV